MDRRTRLVIVFTLRQSALSVRKVLGMTSSSNVRWFARRVVVLLAMLALPVAVAIGCGSEPPIKKNYHSCKLNSDCKGSLVCSFGLCHAQCADSTDCPAPQRCVKVNTDDEGSGEAGASADATQNVCQLPSEVKCEF